jgi:sec-independent protein translocase protein TatA
LTRPRAGGTIRRKRATRPGARGVYPMFGLGPLELGIILVIVVVLFGARRLPEIGSGFGKAIKNFKAGISGDDEIDVTPDKEKIDQGEKSDGSST